MIYWTKRLNRIKEVLKACAYADSCELLWVCDESEVK